MALWYAAGKSLSRVDCAVAQQFAQRVILYMDTAIVETYVSESVYGDVGLVATKSI